jgi:hypothetical protein
MINIILRQPGHLQKYPPVCFPVVGLLLLFAVNGYSQARPKPKPATANATAQKSFVMCEVLPGTAVASMAPFTIPFTNAVAWPTATIKTGCRYIFKNTQEEAGVSIALTDLGSGKNAESSYRNAREASKDLWGEAPMAAIVLQDTGFVSGKDECGLKFHLGKYILDINFKGQYPDVTDDMKRKSGLQLAEMVIRRLSYLWKRE